MPGPEETRLLQALDGTHPGKAAGGASAWDYCASVLDNVSASLAQATMPIEPGDAGGQTAAAMTHSFHRSADAMQKRAVTMRRGKAALDNASQAVRDAHEAHTALGPEPGVPTYTPHEDPSSPAGIRKHNAFLGDMAAYDAKREHRERVSREQADRMDAEFKKSSATMKEIHGIPDPPPPPQGYSGQGGHSGAGSHAPALHHTGGWSGGGGNGTTIQHHHTGSGGGDTGGGHGGGDGSGIDDIPGGGSDAGTSQGGTTTTSPGVLAGEPGPSTALPASSTGLSGSAGLGLAGAAAGGIGSGVLGTGLAAGGIRGGGLAPITTGGGTAASGVRGIGATSRAGVSGTLGRSGAMSSVASGTSTSSRGTGSTAGRGAGGPGAGGRGGAGSRGSAGGRGAASGSTVGGRSGRSRDDERKSGHDEFDIDEDWVDDEGVAPGVLD